MQPFLTRLMTVPQAKAGITKDIQDHMTEASKVLSKGRKKRVMPEGLATVDDIEKFGLLSSHPLHKSTKVRVLTLHSALPCISGRYMLAQESRSKRALPQGLVTGGHHEVSGRQQEPPCRCGRRCPLTAV